LTDRRALATTGRIAHFTPRVRPGSSSSIIYLLPFFIFDLALTRYFDRAL
jgi:hypothetical protein